MKRTPRWFIPLLALGVFMGPFGGNMIVPMFRTLEQWFGVDVAAMSFSITVYMIPFSVLQLFSGLLSDALKSRRAPLAFGFALYSIGSIAAALSPSIEAFLASRAIQGSGSAFIQPLILAMVGDLFPRHLRGRVMGILMASITAGVSLGALAGGFFSSIDWRIGFYALTAYAAMLALFYAFFLRGEKSTLKCGDLKIAEVFGELLHSKTLLLLCLAGFTAFLAQSSFYAFFSETLSHPPFSLPENLIGLLVFTAGIGGVFSSPVAGILVDKLGRRWTLLLGGFLYTGVFASFCITPLAITTLLPVLFLLGFSLMLYITPMSTMVVEDSPKFRATATSLYNFSRFLGYAVGPSVLLPLFYLHQLPGILYFNFLLLLSFTAVLHTVLKVRDKLQ